MYSSKCRCAVDNFEKLCSSLTRLMVEGDLLEVSLPEKPQLRHVLRTCRPTDYEQTVFGFPVSASAEVHINYS